MRALRLGYAQRYERDFSVAVGTGSDGYVAEVASWLVRTAQLRGTVDEIETMAEVWLDAAWANARYRAHRYPWRWLVQDAAAIWPEGGARQTEVEAWEQQRRALDEQRDEALGRGDFDRVAEIDRELTALARSKPRRKGRAA